MKILVVLLSALLLSGCTSAMPSAAEQWAEQSSAPVIVDVPDTHDVIYSIIRGSDTPVDLVVSLTFENGMGGTNQIDATLPFTYEFTAESGDFVYISAQMNGDGKIACIIDIDGDTPFLASASGAYAIATCSGSVP